MWAILLKQLLKDLQVPISEPQMVNCDVVSSIQLAKNLVFHARTKHMEVHYHFIRERVLRDEVELPHICTDQQVPDIFTKPLGLDKLRHFSEMLGLWPPDVPYLRGREHEEAIERIKIAKV